MRRLLTLALVAVLFTPVAAQQDSKERAAEILKKIELTIQKESERSRAELLDLVRQELRGTKPVDPAQGKPEPKAVDPAPKVPALSTEKARAIVTIDLLKKHAGYLASDELEGRCAGYPGCDKAADYIAESFKKSGLKPAGDNGT